MTGDEFRGLPPGLFAFFDDLARDNSKAFWQANKGRWERDVREPMRVLLAELTDEFGPLRMFRPNRDLRFSRDPSPYRLWTGATGTDRAVGGVGHYLAASANALTVGYGAMAMAPGQLRRFRAAVDGAEAGAEFERLTAALEARALPLSPGADEPLKTAPRGYSSDHPRIRFLRWKGAAVIKEWDVADWMHTAAALDAIREVWRAAAPLRHWLELHVGHPDG